MEPIRTIKPRNWWYELFAAAEVACIAGLFCLFVRPVRYGVYAGFATYLLLSRVLRAILLRAHRRGQRMAAAGRYQEAYEAFRKSRAFFLSHSRIDKYRWITVFSTSKYSYHDMAAINMAACCARLGRIDEERALYGELRERLPDDETVRDTIRRLDEARNRISTEI